MFAFFSSQAAVLAAPPMDCRNGAYYAHPAFRLPMKRREVRLMADVSDNTAAVLYLLPNIPRLKRFLA
jgi:hypothetical protein